MAIGTLMAATTRGGVTSPDIDPDDVLLALAGIAIAAGAADTPEQTTRMIDLLHAGTIVPGFRS